MIEFENIGYMDLQKTGSTWTVNVLKAVLDEPVTQRTIHKPITNENAGSKLYFISVREPVALYVSLYKFGLQGRGMMQKRFKKRGLDHMYAPSAEAFETWIDFILDPANADHVAGDYNKRHPANEVGVLTYRLMRLSVPKKHFKKDGMSKLAGEELEAAFRKHAAFDAYIRTERLDQDLHALLAAWGDRVRLARTLPAADQMRETFPSRNATKPVEWLTPAMVGDRIRDRIHEREWLYRKAFGYDVDPKGVACDVLASRKAA